MSSLLIPLVLLLLVAGFYAGFLFRTITLVAFLACILLLPKLPVIQIEDYLIPIRTEDFLLALLLAIVLVTAVLLRRKPYNNPLTRRMVLYSAVTFCSLLYGLSIHAVQDYRIGFLYWFRSPEYFLTILLALGLVRQSKQVDSVLTALLIITCVVGIYGLAQEFSLVPIFDAMKQENEILVVRYFPDFGQERMFSTFAGPYDLAAYYLLALPIFIGMYFFSRDRAQRLLLQVTIALSVVCFYLTYSRTPLIALAVAVFVCLSMLGRAKIAIWLAVMSLLPVIFLAGFKERLLPALQDPFTYYALGGRLAGSWAYSFAALFRSPLLGTGPSSIEGGMGVDSLYMLLLGSFGLLGTVAFVYVIFGAMKLQKRLFQVSCDSHVRALALGMYAGTIALLINGVTVETFLSSKVAFTYWFLMGLLLAARTLELRRGGDLSQLAHTVGGTV